MKRLRAGDYVTPSGRYRVIRAWGEDYARRRWTLFLVEGNGDSEIVSDYGSLREARLEVERLEGEQR